MLTRLRSLREARSLSQKEVSAMLNIARTTYSDYELGKLNVPIPVLISLFKYYQTSVDYLLGLTDVAEPYPQDEKA